MELMRQAQAGGGAVKNPDVEHVSTAQWDNDNYINSLRRSPEELQKVAPNATKLPRCTHGIPAQSHTKPCTLAAFAFHQNASFF